ncbi:MAG: hypothetical protein DRH89_10350, partial [Candidatus Cloacimonadota bacterium]
MKKLLIIIIIIFTVIVDLLSQIPSNLDYIQTLDRTIIYEATLLTHNNKLYVDAKGGIEEYQILSDGSLEQLSYISTFHYSIANAIILGDSLFVATECENQCEVLIIDISESPMELVDVINTNVQYGMFKLAGNENYFMYNPAFSSYSYVYNRTTMEYITQIITGGYFTVHSDYLFYQLTYNDSTFLGISDISDLNNITQNDSIYIGMNEQNMGYFFYDDLLFISQNTQIVILDISDIFNPYIISTISNIPSVPFVNFFKTLFKYNDYLVFGNTETKFWIYDISDLSFPQLVDIDSQFYGGTSSKNSLLLNDDNIYYSRCDRNICLMNADELPDLNVIDEIGNYGQFIYYDYLYPFLIYSNYYTEAIRVTDFSNTNPISFELLESANTFVSSFYITEDIIGFFVEDDFSQKYLNLYSIDQGNINFETSNLLPLSNFEEVAKFGDYIALIAEDDGEIQVCEINQDLTLDYVHQFSTGEDCRIVEQTNQCSQDQVFVTSEINNENVVTIYSTQYPFDEVDSFSLDQYGSYISRLYRLSNDRILMFGWDFLEGFNILAEYNAPDDIQILDNHTIYNGRFRLHNDVLVKSRNSSGEIEFVSWDSDQFEILGSHEFELETADCFFDYDNNKTYTIGRYNIQEYSCDFVSVKDHQIPVIGTYLSNHPNPFNPSTEISFQISDYSEVESAEIAIYNIKG